MAISPSCSRSGLISRECETRPETCIDQESRNPHRKIKEAVHIQLEGAKLNRTEGWELPKTYLPLLRREAAGAWQEEGRQTYIDCLRRDTGLEVDYLGQVMEDRECWAAILSRGKGHQDST
ncbi:hypothetical protein Bbelb_241620 [Branchiostoma belcheri]|nr:hypothetical protein Bbelb_241620 [Branchiostoma belcheri]